MSAAALALATSVVLSAATPQGSEQARLVEAYGQMPLTFEANAGQADPQVAFLARGAGYALFLTPGEAVLSLRPSSASAKSPGLDREQAGESSPPVVLRLKCVGANPSPNVSGLDRRTARSNYFIGNDPSRWRTDVPHFGKVRYEQIYPGIDLVYYGRQRQLEFDFVVQPGADPRQINLAFEGADRIETDAEGDLIVHIGASVLRQHKPVAYQERDGERQPVVAAYVVEGRRAAFRLGDYDPARPVVIDPVLVYSTYLGGSGYDEGHGIAVDGSGNAYVTGATSSTDFPTANPIRSANAGGWDVFVAKLDAAGSALVYSTYLGGSGWDIGFSIAVGGSGDAYVTGRTDSTDFVAANPIQGANAGGEDVFVAKLNATGSVLVYSTYLGGSGSDEGWGIAVDGSGKAYVTGYTRSTNFPTANPIQGANVGVGDVFVAKLNAAGSVLVYSTYLGGGYLDEGHGVAVDALGNAYVTGNTYSTNFPTVNPIHGANGGNWDAFVAKVNAAGSALVYSTYLGGSGNDYGLGIAVDGSGRAYVTGGTESTNFPTVNPIQGAKAAYEDVFVAKLSVAGSALVYSTYLGGGGFDRGYAIAVDGSGNAYVTGETYSTDFPTANPILGAYAGSLDVFVAKVNAAGSALAYSTYLGGSSYDGGWGIAVDGFGDAYVTGRTQSNDFLTVNPIQGASAGITDAFVAKIAVPALSIDDPAVLEGDSGPTDLVFTVTLSPAATGQVTVDYAPADGTAHAGSDYVPTSGTLTFDAGVTSQTLAVQIIGDLPDEADETFSVSLTNAVGAEARIEDPQGVGTILDDDPLPTLSIDSVASREGNVRTTPFVFTVTLTGPTEREVRVEYVTVNGTARSQGDYRAVRGTLIFAPAQTAKAITVPVVGDRVREATEVFYVRLWDARNASIAPGTSRGAIINDD